MDVTRKRLAMLLVFVGSVAVVIGVGLIYPAAAVILAGLAVAGVGFLGIEVGR